MLMNECTSYILDLVDILLSLMFILFMNTTHTYVTLLLPRTLLDFLQRSSLTRKVHCILQTTNEAFRFRVYLPYSKEDL